MMREGVGNYRACIEQLGWLTTQQRMVLLTILTIATILVSGQFWLRPTWQDYQAQYVQLRDLERETLSQDDSHSVTIQHPPRAPPVNWSMQLAEHLLRDYHAKGLVVTWAKHNARIDEQNEKPRLHIIVRMSFDEVLSWLNSVQHAKVMLLSLQAASETASSQAASMLTITMEVTYQ